MREIADDIGVVHSALYRHFPSRAHLLAAVAEEGFGELLHQLQKVDKASDENATERLKTLCHAYVEFGRTRGPLYRVMFGSEVVAFDVAGTSFHSAANAVLEFAIEAVARCQRAGTLEGRDPMGSTLVLWAAIHGTTMLAIDGRLEPKLSGLSSVHDLLELSLRSLLRGLAESA